MNKPKELTEQEIAIFWDYYATTATKHLIIGFENKGTVYFYYDILSNVFPHIRLTSSMLEGYSDRLQMFATPKAYQAELIDTGATIELIDYPSFEQKRIEYGLNRGELFEKLIVQFFGYKYQRDNTPYYIKGDININNTEYQIKFERATLADIATIERAKNGGKYSNSIKFFVDEIIFSNPAEYVNEVFSRLSLRTQLQIIHLQEREFEINYFTDIIKNDIIYLCEHNCLNII